MYFNILFSQAIFYHNAFGKGKEEYNPDVVSTAALALQLADKTDIGNWRVFPSHITPDSVKSDENFHHRCVPYCTLSKAYEIDLSKQKIVITYVVDPGRITAFLKEEHGNEFPYSFGQYIEDFSKAYHKNFEWLRDAARIILYERFQDRDEHVYLEVHLVCSSSNERHVLSF